MEPGVTNYERQCYFWLMRELGRELGIQFDTRPGPKRKLTDGEARAITTIVMSRPKGERESMIDRLAEHLQIGKTTVKRAMEPYRGRPATIRLASSTERAMPARPPSESIVEM